MCSVAMCDLINMENINDFCNENDWVPLRLENHICCMCTGKGEVSSFFFSSFFLSAGADIC